MRLVEFNPVVKGALRGFATVALANGLTICDCPVLVGANDRAWAALPSKPMVDGKTGQHLTDGDGKKRYEPILRWRDRALADRFSAAVVDLVQAQSGRAVVMITASDIARQLASRIEQLAADLLPNGRREGTEWRCGGVTGEAGHSLGVHLRGPKAGVWCDFATGVSGDALGLIRAVLGLDMPSAMIWACEWLGRDDDARALRALWPRHRRVVAPTRSALIVPAMPNDPDPNPDRWQRPWREARPITGTLAERYLVGRGLLFIDPQGDVLRFHPRRVRRSLDDTAFEHHPALLALLRDVITGEPCGLIDIYLQPDGSDRLRDRKGKKTTGRARGAAVMLSAFEDITLGLAVCEGIETGLALLMDGIAPVWALGGAGNLGNYPLLAGLEALTIASDADEAGQHAATKVTERWRAAGREAVIVAPPTGDWGDASNMKKEPA
jgi:hypothetical protein